ncbi:uncharacterized protein AMSG_00501 [Thecamonas trahens ATCC 50062]|uniref:Uncharacterized protein n=1 Tax=Thecamonas trahens ATCC 50062 TaxID=461836 RepID=A0A0L0D9I9_THETB|nr:hypothetical protein AMSG_00501 [Thecamonas trahens ATCC 50062]KNC48726.1 hypothetical protein AMSG_00501 [Thecamonas trahens ATCC 50062]|eukprot:XP_013762778.1 hypothetical protein AMSG_00501 [Thecamonas trahens ATCC 50062]
MLSFASLPALLQFLSACRASPQARARALAVAGLTGGDAELPAALLELYEAASNETVKVVLLAFLGEVGVLLYPEPDALRTEGPRLLLQGLMAGLTEPGSELSVLLRSSLLSALATLLLSMNAVAHAPDMVDSLVCLLLDNIATVNAGSDLLREAMCEALLQLEAAAPGLLAPKLPALASLAQAEAGPACQAYMRLVALVLDNVLTAFVHLHPGDDVSSTHSDASVLDGALALALSQPAGPVIPDMSYSLPLPVVNAALAASVASGLVRMPHPLSERHARDVRTLITLLFDSLRFLSPLAVHDVLMAVASVLASSGLPHSLLKLPAAKLLASSHIVSLHTILCLVRTAPWQAFLSRADVEVTLVARLTALVNGLASPLAHRLLALHWLLSLASTVGLHLDALLPALMPSALDPLELVHAKLVALPRLIPLAGLDLGGGAFLWPHAALAALTALDDFMYCEPSSRLAAIWFDVLTALWRAYPPLRRSLRNASFALVAAAPRFIPALLAWIHVLAALPVDASEYSATWLMDEYASMLGEAWRVLAASPLAAGGPAGHVAPVLRGLALGGLVPYLPLVEVMASQTRIAPRPLISALAGYVRLALGKSSALPPADWRTGMVILDIANVFMLVHPLALLLKPLGALLTLLRIHYPEIVVRDRAELLFRLLTHAPADKLHLLCDDATVLHDPIATMLTAIDKANEASRAAAGTSPGLRPRSRSRSDSLSASRMRSRSRSDSLSAHLDAHDPVDELYAAPPGFLALQRAARLRTAPAANAELASPPPSPDQPLLTVAAYLDSLGDAAHSLDLHFRVQYQDEDTLAVLAATPRPTDDSGVVRPSRPIPSSLFGLVLRFKTPPALGTAAEATVPYLVRAGDAAATSALVTVALTPRRPLPCLVEVDMIYTDQSGFAAAADLGMVKVEVEDLFLAPPCLPLALLAPLWDELWQSLAGVHDSIRVSPQHGLLARYLAGAVGAGLVVDASRSLVFVPPRHHVWR